MRTLLAVLGVVGVMVTSASPAQACTYIPPTPFVVDPSQVGVDTVPPTQVKVTTVSVYRDPYRSGASCWDGIATITVDTPADDRTSAEAIGFRMEVVDGTSPELYTNFYPGPVMGSPGESGQFLLYLPWSEPEPDPAVLPPIRFTVRITPMDAAGNPGPSTDVVVADPGGGDGGGCSASPGSRGIGLVPLVMLLVVATSFAGILRRRERVRG
jgi:hypothetical protein